VPYNFPIKIIYLMQRRIGMAIHLKTENTATSENLLFGDKPNNEKILLVGNEQLMPDLLQHQLGKLGYQVQQKHPDEAVSKSIAQHNPDLILLDIGFDSLAMLAIMPQIRSVYSGLVVLLTSRDNEQEQVQAFNLGVDEYLIKPIAMRILEARVAALFKRVSQSTANKDQAQIQVGELILFPHSHKCLLAGKNVVLTQFEFKLLRLLVDNNGKIMNRDFIYQQLLGRVYNGSERTVDVRVSQLREKLFEKNSAKLRIETVWGKGYMLSLTG